MVTCHTSAKLRNGSLIFREKLTNNIFVILIMGSQSLPGSSCLLSLFVRRDTDGNVFTTLTSYCDAKSYIGEQFAACHACGLRLAADKFHPFLLRVKRGAWVMG